MKRRIGKALIAAAFLVGVTGFACFGVANSKGKMKIEDYHCQTLGQNVYIFSPEDSPEEVNEILDSIYEKQETNQFGDERYAVYFLPGQYDDSIEVPVGFYTQIAGLGLLPTDTKINSLECLARWLGDDSNHNACCNFWRGVENIEIESNTTWAVSQATFMRRTQIDGALFLHDDYGWASGGFLADSNVELMVDSGSQQQWLARNCSWKKWVDSNWNMVFLGTEEGENPTGTWPALPYTDAGSTDRIQEKPFLIYDEEEGFEVYVPKYRENASGTSWEEENENSVGEKISLDEFYVAKEDTDTAQTINEALEDGKNLILTPGVYQLDESLEINNPGTIVLGLGLATLRPMEGSEAIVVSEEAENCIVAGVLFDAGAKESENLLVVDGDGANLSDLFFRVGGATDQYDTQVKACLTINGDGCTGDNFWVWRADHGDGVGWDTNRADNGMIVNGSDVEIYGLMVEHFNEYQTVWNGDGGKVVMYQSEIPYDVPNQESWLSHDGDKKGYASFYVAPEVDNFFATGLGIYLYNRDTAVELETAMELPDKEGVSVEHICTVMLTGYPGMDHIINDSGGPVYTGGQRQVIVSYCNGQVD